MTCPEHTDARCEPRSDLSDYKTHMLSNTTCPSPLLSDSETLRFMHAFQGSFEVGIKSIFYQTYGNALVTAGFNYCTRWNDFSPKITLRLCWVWLSARGIGKA